jgi:hypothetical protein
VYQFRKEVVVAKKEPYWEMTTAELAEATRRFDQEFVADAAKPLTPRQKAREARARAKGNRGRPRVGQGATAVLVSVERGLLRRSDAFAKRRGITRSQLIARGLEFVLSNGGGRG